MRLRICHFLACLAAVVLTAADARAGLADGGEYYIISDYYNKVLGLSTDGSTPRLSDFATTGGADSYVIVAEKSGTDGWWFLRNKQTGRYLKASTQNTWSVLWSESKGTGNEFLWSIDVRFGGRITSKKSTDKRLGCDWTEDETVPVYYDKPASSRSCFSVVPALAEGYETSLQKAETDYFTNAQGRTEKDFWQIGETTTVADNDVDIHIVSNEPFATSARLNIDGTDTWVVFNHVSPSEVISNYLSHIRFDGRTAYNGVNVRVAIWLDGAAVIPCRPTDTAFTGYAETGLAGSEVSLNSRNYKTLGANANLMRSFVLKRGYMATLASGENGKGYSRVYVADHADIVVEALPEQLDRRISSVNIRPWQYVGKKGWCSTQKSESIADQMNRLHATWFYTWSADRETTADHEYVPIRQHIYWPSLDQINGLTASTHVLGFNEPEHSEQHSSEKCSCGGAIDSWKATTYTPDLQESGMRIGSPSPTDAKWLYEYIGHCDDMTYRCDFVAIHAYWGPNEANGASAWYNTLKEIYDKTHRPIWITEWAYGASWTTESWPSGYNDQLEKNRAAIMEIQDMLERCPFVERYSYYQWDTSSRRFINDDGWMTPAGRVYRDAQQNFAYDASMQYTPHWWRPSTKASTLACSVNPDDRTLTFMMGNTNGDCTDTFVLQRITQDGTVENLFEVSDRSQLENATFTFTIPLDQVDRTSDQYRIKASTLFGGDASSQTATAGFIHNPDADQGLDHWTCSNLSTNQGEAWDGNTANVYWNQWKANGLTSSMSQQMDTLEDGEYTVSTLVRGSSNVTITMRLDIRHADGTEIAQTVTLQGKGNTSTGDSEWPYGWQTLTLPPFTAQSGDTAKLTLSAQGSGSAWWSADHVQMQFTAASTPTVINGQWSMAGGQQSTVYDLQGRLMVNGQWSTVNSQWSTVNSQLKPGIYIINGKKVFIK